MTPRRRRLNFHDGSAVQYFSTIFAGAINAEDVIFFLTNIHRHYGGNLGKAGVAPKTAQILTRHSDLSLTMNIYTHVDQQEQAAAINLLPSIPGLKKPDEEGGVPA